MFHQAFILEEVFLRIRFQEKAEPVVHCHLDHRIERGLELTGFFLKHQPPLVVGKRILLPVDVMIGRSNLE